MKGGSKNSVFRVLLFWNVICTLSKVSFWKFVRSHSPLCSLTNFQKYTSDSAQIPISELLEPPLTGAWKGCICNKLTAIFGILIDICKHLHVFLRHDAILCSIFTTFGSGATHKGVYLCCVAALGITARHFATFLITFAEKSKAFNTLLPPPIALFTFSAYICGII